MKGSGKPINYIVNIENSHTFNLESPKDAIDFLILILNKENLYISNVSGIIFQTLGITASKYAEKNRDKAFFSIAMDEVAKFFNIFLTGNEFNNPFYNYLIEDVLTSDLIKKQKIDRLLSGIKKYIDYLWEMDCVSIIDYHYKRGLDSLNTKEEEPEDFHETLKKDNVLHYSIPSYWVYVNIKTIYDFIWTNFSPFIDKEKQKFSYFYSNKKTNKDNNTYKPENNHREKLSRDVIFNYLFNSPKSQEIFKSYESKLEESLFLNNGKDKWLKDASSLIRFYNYCEAKNFFKDKYKGSSEGVRYLRELYNFYEGENIDTPSKRIRQNTKRNKNQFFFLNVVTNFK